MVISSLLLPGGIMMTLLIIVIVAAAVYIYALISYYYGFKQWHPTCGAPRPRGKGEQQITIVDKCAAGKGEGKARERC